jgi:hypothetical protein
MGVQFINPFLFGTSGGNPSGALAQWLAPWQEAASNGDRLATLTDFSGNGRHMTQATAANKPQFDTNVLNSQPGFFFNGSAYYAECASFFSGTSQEAELICVIKLPGTQSGNGFAKFDGDGFNSHMVFSGTIYNSFGRDRQQYTPASGILTAGFIHHVASKFGTNEYKMFENGNTTRVTATRTGSIWPTSTFTMGASNGNSSGAGQAAWFHGWILDWRVYNRILTASERNAVMADINTRHGISYTSF